MNDRIRIEYEREWNAESKPTGDIAPLRRIADFVRSPIVKEMRVDMMCPACGRGRIAFITETCRTVRGVGCDDPQCHASFTFEGG